MIFAFLMLAATPSYAGFDDSYRREAQIGVAIGVAIVAVVAISYFLIRDKSESSEMSDESIGLNKLLLNTKIGLSYFDQDSYRGDSLKNFTPMLQIKLHF